MKMTIAQKPLFLGAALSAAIILAGCGETSGTASGRDGASVGPITGFGSVYVNGIQFDTDAIAGAVTSDDGIDHEDDLVKGMLLLVDGDWRGSGQGEARGLYYDDTLRGQVESYSWDEVSRTGSMTVLMQDITLTERTLFGGTLTRDEAGNPPTANDNVRVSGWRQADGSFVASFVGLYSGGEEGDDRYELEGTVEALDDIAGVFKIGALEVDYSNAEFDDFNRNELANGLLVEVEGGVYSAGRLQATEIELESERYRDFAGDDIEFSGLISTDLDSNNEFTINGLTVRVVGNTEFDDGLTENDLLAGMEVKVEGDFNADGIVIAEEIEPRESDSEVEARLESKDPGLQQLTVGGVTVQVNASTLITDDENDDRRIGFTDLQVGQYLEIEGRVDTSGASPVLVATMVERDDDDDEYELEGRITETDGSSYLVALGVRIEITDSTTFEEGAALREGREVELTYEAAAATYNALEIEVEDEDDDDD